MGNVLGLVPLPKTYLLLLLVIMTGYIIVTEAVKRLYIKVNKDWI
jgi:hypothetical protein